LDRASGYEPEGRLFESARAHQKINSLEVSAGKIFHQPFIDCRFGSAWERRLTLFLDDGTFEVGHRFALVFGDHFHVVAEGGRRVVVPHLTLGVFDGATV
jgi:hypothetical protein